MNRHTIRIKPDSMLIEPEMIAEAHRAVAEPSEASYLEALKQREPTLGCWIEEQLLVVAGKMTHQGAPRNAIAGTFVAGKMGICGARRTTVAKAQDEFLSILTIALDALRAGYLESWRDSIAGTPLERTLGMPHATGDSSDATVSPHEREADC